MKGVSLRRYSSLAGLVAAVMAFLFAAAVPARADDASDRAALDQLFAALRNAPDALAAHAIDQRIWIYWTEPSDPDKAQRMHDVLVARRSGEYALAIEMLDKMVADYPTYAEAWNQRATLYFIVGRYEDSLADIDKVLEFEPRHFGALSGRALIYLQQGKRALALRDIATALKVHPFLEEQNLFPELQRDVTHI